MLLDDVELMRNNAPEIIKDNLSLIESNVIKDIEKISNVYALFITPLSSRSAFLRSVIESRIWEVLSAHFIDSDYEVATFDCVHDGLIDLVINNSDRIKLYII